MQGLFDSYSDDDTEEQPPTDTDPADDVQLPDITGHPI